MAKRKRQPKWKPEVSKAWVTWTPVGFGVMLWMLFVPDFVAPVGLVWGTQHVGRRRRTFTEFEKHVDPKMVTIHWRKILVVEEER